MFDINKMKEVSLYEASSSADGITINVFDFDNTLFKSPVPNPKLWSRKAIGKLGSEVSQNGIGWYQNTLTLSDKYIKQDNFIESTVDDVKKSMNDPNSVTVLLTGRNVSYTDIVKFLVQKKGLRFDYMGLKPFGLKTFNFKTDFIRNIISDAKSNNKKVIKINIWEDREEHISKFDKFFSNLGYPYEIHKVTGGEYHMDPELEKELVSRLIEDANKESGKEIKMDDIDPVNYYGIFLNDESKKILVDTFKESIPEGWKIVADHLTIVPPKMMGKIDPNTQKIIDDRLNTSIELTVNAIGISYKAMAAGVNFSSSMNKTPHITIAVSPTGKPRDSNDIAYWENVTPLKLTGTLLGKK